MKAIYIVAALALSVFSFTPASAAPAAPAARFSASAVPSPVLQVQFIPYYDSRGYRDHRRHRYDRRYYDDRRHRPRYVPGHRYKSAPHGWHRYDRRPRDWRYRGCIMVGPFWFCE